MVTVNIYSYSQRSNISFNTNTKVYNATTLSTPPGHNLKRVNGLNRKFLEEFSTLPRVQNKLQHIIDDNEFDQDVEIAIFCKNGQHRSVALVQLLAIQLHGMDHQVYVHHLSL